MRNQNWTPEEDAILIKNWHRGRMNIAIMLGRTQNSVSHHAQVLRNRAEAEGDEDTYDLLMSMYDYGNDRTDNRDFWPDVPWQLRISGRNQREGILT